MKKQFTIFCALFIVLVTQIKSQPTNGLIGYWPFTNGANDFSGYSNNGKVNNAIQTMDRFGISNSAYSFSGNNSYIDLGNNIAQIQNQMTVSVWIKTTNPHSSVAYIVGKYGWDNSYMRGFHMLMNNYIQFAGRDQTAEYNYITSGSAKYYDNMWHHLVGIINNSIYELWIDGVKIGTLDNHHASVDISNNYNLYIGAHYLNGVDQNMHFTGNIDDVRLYNRALSSSEILQLYTENSSVTTWTISASANPLNGGTITGEGNYIDGQTATLKATPNANFSFANWTENGNVVSTDLSYQFVVSKTRMLVANFKQTSFSIVVSSNPIVGGSVSGSGTYKENQTVKVKASPYPGYLFSYWTVAGTIVSEDSLYEFIPTKDRNLVANFISLNYSIRSVANPSDGGTVTGVGNFKYGQQVELKGIPASGYSFSNWTENGVVVSTTATYKFTVNNDRYLIASFTRNQLTIYTSANPASLGSTSGGGVYSYGDKISVIAKPNPGNRFVSWVENNYTVSDKEVYEFTVTSNRNLIANFATIPTLKVSPENQTVPFSEGSYSFTIENTTGGMMAWDAVSNNSWLTISEGATGSNNGKVVVKVSENSGDQRTGSITIASTGAINSPKTIEIKQQKFVSVEKEGSEIPNSFYLFQNYPNPFNPETNISWQIASGSFVTLKVFNTLGNEVACLVDEFKAPGKYRISLSAKKLNLSSGIYYYQLRAGNQISTKKFVLTK